MTRGAALPAAGVTHTRLRCAGGCAVGGERAWASPGSPFLSAATHIPSLLLLLRQVSPTAKGTSTNEPALSCLFLLLLWEKKKCNHSLACRDPFRCCFQAGRGLVCAAACALCAGTMTGLQADQQDGYDNYAGIFFPCLALLVTACHCVFAIPAWDLGQTHTRSPCKGPA